MDLLRVINAAAWAWAAALLAGQLALGRRDRRPDFSVAAGRAGRGVIYAFTRAMSPARKETIRLNPVKFLAGVALHAGVLAALVKVIIILSRPEAGPIWPPMTTPALALAALAGVFLLLRRAVSPELRAMSAPDDFISAALTLGLVIAAALHELGFAGPRVLLIASAALLFYLPLGKLRHALFCVVARAEYGWRLGRRGVYPSPTTKE